MMTITSNTKMSFLKTLFYFFIPALSCLFGLYFLRLPLVSLGLSNFFAQLTILTVCLFGVELILWWFEEFYSQKEEFSFNTIVNVLGLKHFKLWDLIFSILIVVGVLSLVKFVLAKPIILPLLEAFKSIELFTPPDWHYQVVGLPRLTGLAAFLLPTFMLTINVVVEEIYFRGFLQKRMEHSFGNSGWILNALLFTAYHIFQGWMIPIIFVLSMGISLIYHFTKSIYGAILAHLLLNLLIGMTLA